MKTQNIEQIKYGYQHWSGKPVTPDVHEAHFVPQTIADAWEVYCSCGQWKAIEHSRNRPSGKEMIEALRAEHERHVKESEAGEHRHHQKDK